MANTPRFPGAVLNASSVAAPNRRDRVLIASCIVLITVLSWAYLLHLSRQASSSVEADTMMEKMGMVMNQPWSLREVGLTFGMWAVMMVGMMTATALPVLLLFAGAHGHRGKRGVRLAVALFGLGYITVWLGFSAFAAAAQWGLHQAALLSSTMATSSTPLAGGILIAAGAYQLTPLKRGCLIRCQSPLGYLMSSWRDGAGGALRMGLRHGAFCLGCCWALMGVLFVVGVMNLAWVGVLTAFILVEKLGSTGARVSRAGGAILIAFGVILVSRLT
jgi:predicted metal-binding membrane protein